jgi:hypothetical protein
VQRDETVIITRSSVVAALRSHACEEKRTLGRITALKAERGNREKSALRTSRIASSPSLPEIQPAFGPAYNSL